MKTWTPLSASYEASNGYAVTPVASEDGLGELGMTLRNGLIQPEARSIWADLCREGKRQIFSVHDASGNLVANGELKVRDGEVRTMFVRGPCNIEMDAGPVRQAVADYVAAANTREISLLLEPKGSGFLSLLPGEEPVDPWDAAKRLAHERFVSPFEALVMGLDADITRTLFEEITWVAMTDRFEASNGFVVEPVSNRSGLRVLGVELENNLFLPRATEGMARLCAEGDLQVLAIYREADGLAAFAEIVPADGDVVVASCRGYADEAPHADVVDAVRGYVAAVNAREIDSRLRPDAGRFISCNDLDIGSPDDWERGEVSPVLPHAIRSIGDDEPGEPDEPDEIVPNGGWFGL